MTYLKINLSDFEKKLIGSDKLDLFNQFNQSEESIKDTILEFKSLTKGGDFKSDRVKDLSLFQYSTMPLHSAYSNDKFFISEKFELDNELKRINAFNSVVANGTIGYFRMISHYGYNLNDVLKKNGYTVDKSIKINGEYKTLEIPLISRIIDNYKLNLNDFEEVDLFLSNYDYSNKFKPEMKNLINKISKYKNSI